MSRATEAMRRGGGAAAARYASGVKWLAQRGKPAAGAVRGGAGEGEARATRCAAVNCACAGG
eukprot:1031387-Pleurochrysis_carterae.AAC.1